MKPAGRRRAVAGAAGVEAARRATYLSAVQMYNVPPTGEIGLEEFEAFALDRIRRALLDRRRCEP